MKEEMTKLENYNPPNEIKIKSKEEVIHNAKEIFAVRNRIIKAFEDGIFPLRKAQAEKEIKEEEIDETIPDWVKVGNYEFKRIKERVQNYVNKRFHAKVDNKTITMNPVKKF